MRAGPLSNSKVIELLNSYFVPVYVVNEDYSKKGVAPPEEKAERDQIFKEGHAAKLSVGSVHVYVLRPNGRILDSMHVAKAAKTTNLIAMLEGAVATLGTPRGSPAIEPCPQAAAPIASDGSLRLHLVARSLDGKGAWSEFPVENWIVFTPDDQQKLLAGFGNSKAGHRWDIDTAVSEKILTHFYPATENNDVSKNRFLEQRLVATVATADGGHARVRLEGRIKMQHNFYHKDDGKVVDADVIGFADLDSGARKVTSLSLVTEKATYGGGQFAVAVRSMP
jgi:hypothetical protein